MNGLGEVDRHLLKLILMILTYMAKLLAHTKLLDLLEDYLLFSL